MLKEIWENDILMGWRGITRDLGGEREVFIPRREEDIESDRTVYRMIWPNRNRRTA